MGNPNSGLHFSGNLFKGTRAWYFHVAVGTGAMFSLPQRSPNAYNSLSFCNWYVIANMVSSYEMNASYIKAIKSTYSAYRRSKTVRKKEMNEYLKVEKETGAYKVARRVVGTIDEHSIRKSRQAVAKLAHPSPSAGGSSRKKARREPEAEVLLQGASQPGLGFAESEEEEEVDPPLIRSWSDRGPATSKGIEVAEGPQSKAPLASIMTLGKGVEMQPGYPSTMMPALKVVKSSLTTGPIGEKAPVAEVGPSVIFVV